MKTIIYADGSSVGNPGPGGYATIILKYENDKLVDEKEYCQGNPYTTNNIMELMAVIEGLEHINPDEEKEFTIRTDSKYIVNAFNKGWLKNWVDNGWRTYSNYPVKNKELWEKLLKLSDKFDTHYEWVKGHDGNDYNERCDKMARDMANSMKQQYFGK